MVGRRAAGTAPLLPACLRALAHALMHDDGMSGRLANSARY